MDKVFQYADVFQLTSGTAGIHGTKQVMNLNGMYDPDSTGTGHQPYGYDNFLGTIYTYYRVTDVEYRVTFTTPGGTTDMLCSAVLGGPGNILNLTGMSPSLALEIPRVLNNQLTPYGERRAVIAGRFPLEKLFGISRMELLTSKDYEASNGANPTKLATLGFAVALFNGGAAQGCSAYVELRYHAKVYGRIGQGQS
jgi:hypothetical protein